MRSHPCHGTYLWCRSLRLQEPWYCIASTTTGFAAIAASNFFMLDLCIIAETQVGSRGGLKYILDERISGTLRALSTRSPCRYVPYYACSAMTPPIFCQHNSLAVGYVYSRRNWFQKQPKTTRRVPSFAGAQRSSFGGIYSILLPTKLIRQAVKLVPVDRPIVKYKRRVNSTCAALLQVSTCIAHPRQQSVMWSRSVSMSKHSRCCRWRAWRPRFIHRTLRTPHFSIGPAFGSDSAAARSSIQQGFKSIQQRTFAPDLQRRPSLPIRRISAAWSVAAVPQRHTIETALASATSISAFLVLSIAPARSPSSKSLCKSFGAVRIPSFSATGTLGARMRDHVPLGPLSLGSDRKQYATVARRRTYTASVAAARCSVLHEKIAVLAYELSCPCIEVDDSPPKAPMLPATRIANPVIDHTYEVSPKLLNAARYNTNARSTTISDVVTNPAAESASSAAILNLLISSALVSCNVDWHSSSVKDTVDHLLYTRGVKDFHDWAAQSPVLPRKGCGNQPVRRRVLIQFLSQAAQQTRRCCLHPDRPACAYGGSRSHRQRALRYSQELEESPLFWQAQEGVVLSRFAGVLSMKAGTEYIPYSLTVASSHGTQRERAGPVRLLWGTGVFGISRCINFGGTQIAIADCAAT
ncbi:hypothetical protein KC335_g69 [Hortaea werneckii]|nr:hypothetical protein KC335_g69 [Hortaea werneckii]